MRGGRIPTPIKGTANYITITINTYNDDKGLNWNDGDTMENAATLLHELGHAFEYLKGAGGFNVKDHENFDAEIKEKCFPKK